MRLLVLKMPVDGRAIMEIKNHAEAAAAEARLCSSGCSGSSRSCTSQAYNASGEISDLAAQACDAADRAQGAADRATANAEGGGW